MKKLNARDNELFQLAAQAGKELSECKALFDAGREEEIPSEKVARINQLNKLLEAKAVAAGYRDADDFFDKIGL